MWSRRGAESFWSLVVNQRLRHAAADLLDKLPDDLRNTPEAKLVGTAAHRRATKEAEQAKMDAQKAQQLVYYWYSESQKERYQHATQRRSGEECEAIRQTQKAFRWRRTPRPYLAHSSKLWRLQPVICLRYFEKLRAGASMKRQGGCEALAVWFFAMPSLLEIKA